MVFAKLNPGIRYVQGMNEILAPLFYVFKNDPDEENVVSIYVCCSSLFFSPIVFHYLLEPSFYLYVLLFLLNFSIALCSLFGFII